MDDGKKILATLVIACGYIIANSKQGKIKKRKRKCWVKPWLLDKGKSVYRTLLNELKLRDKEHFRRYLRMNTETFEVRIFFIKVYMSLIGNYIYPPYFSIVIKVLQRIYIFKKF